MRTDVVVAFLTVSNDSFPIVNRPRAQHMAAHMPIRTMIELGMDADTSGAGALYRLYIGAMSAVYRLYIGSGLPRPEEPEPGDRIGAGECADHCHSGALSHRPTKRRFEIPISWKIWAAS